MKRQQDKDNEHSTPEGYNLWNRVHYDVRDSCTNGGNKWYDAETSTSGACSRNRHINSDRQNN